MKTLTKLPYFEKFLNHFDHPGLPTEITDVLFNNIKDVQVYLFNKEVMQDLIGLDLKNEEIFNSLDNKQLPSNCVWFELSGNVLMEYSNTQGSNSAVIGALVVNEDTNYSGLLFVCEFQVMEQYTHLFEDTLKVAYFNFDSSINNNDANKMLQIMIQKYNSAITESEVEILDPMVVRIGQNKKRFDINNIFYVKSKLVKDDVTQNS